MQNYNDGNYITKKGTALIAKILAGGGETALHFTKATVGKGIIPLGVAPEDMTSLSDEVMNGYIASIENNRTGEVSIVVQVSSLGVEQGFSVSELGLWADDPDEGEILYTYVILREQPEWIRPESDSVNKLAVFTLVTIVAGVPVVTAEISQDSFVTMADLAKYALIGHTHEPNEITGLQDSLLNIEEELSLLRDIISGDMPGGITFTADFVSLSNVSISDGIVDTVTRQIYA